MAGFNEMIEIDGSYGEGGGQILRTSVSLSALTLKPVRITKIRAGRPKPGLKRQHMASIDLTAQLVNAKVRGLKEGSTEIEFIPSERASGRFRYDIGTAGSISLLLQAVLPPAILSGGTIRLELKGGTDVSWSPPIDYVQEVFLPIIRRMGPDVEIVMRRRGHYPKGGGLVSVGITPCDSISNVDLVEFGRLKGISGISHCVRLPSHIADRQAKAAERVLVKKGLPIDTIVRESYPRNSDPHLGPGSGIVLWAESEKGLRVGADLLGSRGKRAEEVGVEAASKLIDELETRRAVDSHIADMLVPYVVLAKGVSKIGVTRITSHLETNIWAAKRILDVDIALEGAPGSTGLITVKGIGFSSGQ